MLLIDFEPKYDIIKTDFVSFNRMILFLFGGKNGNAIANVNAAFLDIENPMDIYPRLQKIIMDIQTDIEFPNAYRPSENPGYNTEFKG